jgi:hypothetical protein
MLTPGNFSSSVIYGIPFGVISFSVGYWGYGFSCYME